MADPKKDHEYWRKQGELLVAKSGSAGLPPLKQDEYFVAPDRDTAKVGSSYVNMPRPSVDSLSDAQGHLVGSVMSRMMKSNYDAADKNQIEQKRRRYYGE